MANKNKDHSPDDQSMRPQAWGPIPAADEIESPALLSEGMTQQEAVAALNTRQYMRHLRETADNPDISTEERAEAIDEIRLVGLSLTSVLYPHMTAERVNQEFEQRQE